MKKEGKSKTRISFDINTGLRKQFKLLAVQSEMTINQFGEKLLSDGVKQYSKSLGFEFNQS